MTQNAQSLIPYSIPPKHSPLFYRQLADRSLFHFVKIVGSKTSGKDIRPELHIPLCEFSMDPTILRKFIVMPRYWLKTTVFTCWKTIWHWLHYPESRQLIVSETEPLASRMLSWIESMLLSNKKLRRLYPDKLGQVDDAWVNNRKHKWSGSACDLPREGIYKESSITAIGIGGAAQSGHYDVIRPDDLVGQSARESKLVMENIMSWWSNVDELLNEPDMSKPNPSSIEGTGTHWFTGDFFCYVQDNFPEYQWRIVPALKDQELLNEDNITWLQNPMVDHGESNWPQHKSTKHYTDMMANPQKVSEFWAQHMNNPKASGLTKFDPEWFQWFHEEVRENGDVWIVCNDDKKDFEFKAKDIKWIAMIDPGGFAETKFKKMGANNAIVIAGQPLNSHKKFVRYVWVGKPQDPEDFLKAVFDAQEKYKPAFWRIETIGAQDYIFRHILLEKKKRHIPMIIAPLPKDVNKDVKDSDIQALIPVASNGELYLMKNQVQLKSELVSYPGGLTVDAADCLAKINRYFFHREGKEQRMKRYLPWMKKEVAQSEASRDSWTGY